MALSYIKLLIINLCFDIYVPIHANMCLNVLCKTASGGLQQCKLTHKLAHFESVMQMN